MRPEPVEGPPLDLSAPVLLDGGLATQLEAQGADLRSRLWSAQLLLDDPAAVVAAHEAFFAAGAQVATTASYQAPVELYGASLADGSEYRGDYGRSVAELRAWHRPRIAALVEAGVDVLALETIPTLVEVEALLEEVAGTGVPCWLSITAAGDRTRAGEPAYAAFALAAEVPEVVAVGVNCLDPDVVPGLLALAAEASGKPGVAYPNRGEGWDADAKTCTAGRPASEGDSMAAIIGQLPPAVPGAPDRPSAASPRP